MNSVIEDQYPKNQIKDECTELEEFDIKLFPLHMEDANSQEHVSLYSANSMPENIKVEPVEWKNSPDPEETKLNTENHLNSSTNIKDNSFKSTFLDEPVSDAELRHRMRLSTLNINETGHMKSYDLCNCHLIGSTCDVCSKLPSKEKSRREEDSRLFPSKETFSLKRKMKMHKNGLSYICDICNKVFYRKDHLSAHMLIHIGDRPYSCDVCNKAFARNSHLKEHERIHIGDRPFCCEVCNKCFAQKSSLNTHIRIHNGGGHLVCIVCSKTFHKKSNLSRHMLTHTGDRPFVCDLCNKTFNDKTTLSKHERIHTGNRPYACDICGKVFSQKGHLNRHINTHTGSRPFLCNICYKAFSRKCTLKVHMQLHTKLSSVTI